MADREGQRDLLVWVIAAAAAAESMLNSVIAALDQRADHFAVWGVGFFAIFAAAAFVERIKVLRGG